MLPSPARLFETHLTVGDLDRSIAFYRDVVGLPLAYALTERGAAFFWIGGPGESMLGLWSLGSAPVRAAGVTPRSFFGAEAEEPSVIGWMPAAAVYFHDPDGHQLEYLAMLDEAPRPERGIVSWSDWHASEARPVRAVTSERIDSS